MLEVNIFAVFGKRTTLVYRNQKYGKEPKCIFEPSRSMHCFGQIKKNLGEIYFVVNFQGCTRCTTQEAWKCLNLKHLKIAIFLEQICFPEKGFCKMTETG